MPKIVLEFRKQLSLTDLHFITLALAGDSPKEADALFRLVTDPDTVDSILDSPDLLDCVLTRTETLSLSPRLYFYLLTRHSLKASGLDSPELADYISGVLESFLQSGFNPHGAGNIFYLVDWLKQVEASPIGKRYELYVTAGNHLLFLTGIFPEFIEKRSQHRGAPGIAFYESVARRSFHSAAEHPFSRKIATKQLYHHVAESFSDVRCALNDLSERLITLE
jgi:hypothetical protein